MSFASKSSFTKYSIKDFQASLTAVYFKDGESVLLLLGAIAFASAASINHDFSSEFAIYVYLVYTYYQS